MKITGLQVPGSVEEVSLTLESGIITGLAGQVGSGTSTILRALGGLVPEATGTIEVHGPRTCSSTRRGERSTPAFSTSRTTGSARASSSASPSPAT